MTAADHGGSTDDRTERSTVEAPASPTTGPLVYEDLTDKELLQLHVDGDPEAFGLLFQRHRDRLWAVALRTLGDAETAADALQDAMISAFRRAVTYRGDAAVTTWLHRIVVNACLDRVRREAVRAADPLPDDDRSAGLADRRDPIVERQTRLDVDAALATLPLEQRAALVLVDMHGYSVHDVAEMLGVAEGTVKSRCSRARAKLVPLLGQYGPAPDGPQEGAGNRSPVRDVPPKARQERLRASGITDEERSEDPTAPGGTAKEISDRRDSRSPDDNARRHDAGSDAARGGSAT